jgi:exonuclease SbcD
VGATAAAEAIGEQLGILLRGFAPINEAAGEMGVPTVGVSHGTVYGCLTEHGVPMAGFDHEFTTGALFGARAQAFMPGHIHRHQSWESSGRLIAYPGSIGRFHYGEEGDKGFLLREIGAEGAQFAFEATPARRTIDILCHGKPDLETIRAAVTDQGIAGAFVRVRWSVPDEDRHDIDRGAMERLLAGAAEVKVEGRIVPVTRTRATGISQGATIAEKVRLWAKVIQAKPEPLLDCLEGLQTHSPEAIAEES